MMCWRGQKKRRQERRNQRIEEEGGQGAKIIREGQEMKRMLWKKGRVVGVVQGGWEIWQGEVGTGGGQGGVGSS